MKIFFPFFLLFFCLNFTFAQTQPDKEALKFNLSEDGKRFFQVVFLNQTWVRYTENNEGTTIQNERQNEVFDIGLRRTRIQMFGQITDRVFLYFQFGQNNFNAQYNIGNNRKFAAFFHDAFCEYKVTESNALKIGAGLTIANGLSRFSQPSIGTIMTMDVPVTLQASVDQTDEFSRKLSLVFRGQISKLDYRVSISNPFPITSNGQALPPLSQNATFTQKGHTLQYQTYLVWQFFEHEPHNTPYMTGTFLGKKKVWNVAVGAISQNKAMWRKEANQNDTTYQDMLLLGIESFLDMPLKKAGMAISAHLGYYNYNFGTNYLRYNGLMNPASGTVATNAFTGVGATFGNAYPMFGSGSFWYGQAGFLFQNRFQPYVSLLSAHWERIGQQTNVWNMGVNWLINQHRAKLSLNYENRPTYSLNSQNQAVSTGNKGAWILQYQITI